MNHIRSYKKAYKNATWDELSKYDKSVCEKNNFRNKTLFHALNN